MALKKRVSKKHSEIIKRKVREKDGVPSNKIKFFSALYKNIPLKRIILIAFVVITLLSILIYGTKVRLQVSIIPIIEIAIVVLVTGMIIFYPEGHSKCVGLIICGVSALIILLEISQGTLNFEVILTVLMLSFGMIVYSLR